MLHDPCIPMLPALLASCARLLGHSLADPALSLVDQALYLYREAPFCLLAHDPSADPRFVYANLTAQRCFESSWQELVGMPSRLSAEAPHRDERARLVAAVTRDGFVRGYRGLRIAKSGRRFWIEDVTMWNVHDDQGQLLGQAAVYRDTTPA